MQDMGLKCAFLFGEDKILMKHSSIVRGGDRRKIGGEGVGSRADGLLRIKAEDVSSYGWVLELS